MKGSWVVSTQVPWQLSMGSSGSPGPASISQTQTPPAPAGAGTVLVIGARDAALAAVLVRLGEVDAFQAGIGLALRDGDRGVADALVEVQSSPVGQTTPQAPQFRGSLSVSVQTDHRHRRRWSGGTGRHRPGSSRQSGRPRRSRRSCCCRAAPERRPPRRHPRHNSCLIRVARAGAVPHCRSSWRRRPGYGEPVVPPLVVVVPFEHPMARRKTEQRAMWWNFSMSFPRERFLTDGEFWLIDFRSRFGGGMSAAGAAGQGQQE